jgi:tRNA (guanine37-N1)-methyltransferase
MRIDVITIFPGMFSGPLDLSIVGRARQRGLVDIRLHDLRDHTDDRHRKTDDAPFGGGAGMVMRPEPWFRAIESIAESDRAPASTRILLTPQGRRFTQADADRLSALPHLVLLCGHYEGFDERVREHLVTEEISIGDYVLTGGELAALVLIDAIVRLLPGAVGSEESIVAESHRQSLLEYPQYTRPAEFRQFAVPDILLSGHHAEIARWRRQQSLQRTLERRPDLLANADLDRGDRQFLASIGAGQFLRAEDSVEPRRRRRARAADATNGAGATG